MVERKHDGAKDASGDTDYQPFATNRRIVIDA